MPKAAASPPPKVNINNVPKKIHSYAPRPFHPTSTEFSAHHHQRSLAVSTLQPLQMTSLQSNFIEDTMKEIRERQAKRQKVCGTMRMMVQHQDGASVDTCSSHQHNDGSIIGSSGTDANRFDILDALDSHPNAAQVVATPGGLITHWNEAFAKLINNSSQQKSRTLPLTIFEIIESKSLPSLYSILALALHNVRIGNVEDHILNDNSRSEKAVDEGVVDGPDRTTSASHLSITLPCKSFPNSSTRYNITIVFMNDVSMKRCFLGILTPRCSSSSNTDDGSSSSTISSCSLASGVSNTSNMKKDQEDNSKQDSQETYKTVKNRERTATTYSDAAATTQQRQGQSRSNLQCGKILRVNDELLCRLLLG